MKDEIDLSSVTILSAPNVRSWPVTAAITRIVVEPENVKFDFTKKDGPDRWPDQIPPGFATAIQYTVWLFLNINGQWYGSGFIEMWQTRDGVGDGISDFVKNWYYAADRWSPMTGHAIQPDEKIGFMLTAGDARNNGQTSVLERSNIVTIDVPPNDGSARTFVTDEETPAPPSSSAPPPADPPPSSGTPPPPAPPLTPPILPEEIGEQLVAAVDRFGMALEGLVDQLKAIGEKLDRLQTNGVKVSF